MPRGSTGDVRVTVGAEVSQLRRGMNEAGAMVKDFTQASQRGGSTVRVLSEAMNSLTGVSGNAGRALGVFSGVLAGLAQGGLAGAAFAAVGGLVQVFKSLKDEASPAAEKMKKGMEELGKAADSATLKMERMAFVQAGGSARMFDAIHTAAGSVAWMTEQREKEAAVLEEIEKAHKNIAKAEELGNAAAALRFREALGVHQDRLTAIQKEIAEVEKQRAAVVAAAKAEDEAERSAKAAKDASTVATKAASTAQEQYALDVKNAVEAVEASNRAVMRQAELEGKVRQQKLEEQAQAEKEAFEGRVAYARREIAEEQKAAEQRIALNQQVGQQLGSMMGSLITGQQTFGQVMAQVGQMVIQEVTKMAIARVTAHATEAAAGAASSQAGIPIIGPVLAISAMGAMLSAVMGLLGNLGSAEGGWDLPAGGPFPAVLHAREMVLPREEADAIRGLASGRGSRGGGTTINNYVSTVDARGYERMLNRNQGAQRRHGRRQARLGRS